LARAALRRQTPEVGAECVNRACSDLCGGYAATRIPTANRIGQIPTYSRRPQSGRWNHCPRNVWPDGPNSQGQMVSEPVASTAFVGAGVFRKCGFTSQTTDDLHDFYGGLRDLQLQVAFECLCRRFV
jgi:hypothetical protein